MPELHELELTLASRTPVLLIESLEEQRIIGLFQRLTLRLPHPMFRWSITEGLRRMDLDYGTQPHTAEPPEVLKHIKSLQAPGYFLLLDFHPYLQDPIHTRLIREIAQGYDATPRTLVLISHALDVPQEITHLCMHFRLSLPNHNQLVELIEDEVRNWKARNGNRQLRVDHSAREQLANNLTGVTTTDARRLIRGAIEDDGAITTSDIPEVMRAKYELMNRDSVIAYEYDTAKFADVAGLERLKTWLRQRRSAFTAKAGSLDRPKGIMLLGVQGCGKSLAAKAVAGSYGIPLLRLDFASLYDKYYGETEKNLHQALRTAEVMAPCVLWIDEIEKGIAHGGTDEGLSRRVLGSLLTWMAEKSVGVFIVATSNDITQLPPELVRKGRLDEIFFVDLPDEKTRQEIFRIHLRRRNLAPSGFDTKALGRASEGFSGAEIEQAIVSARYAAHAQDQRLTTPHLLDEMARTRPLSVVMAERITQLREWAAGRTVPAG